MLMNLLHEVFRQSSYVTESSRQYSLTPSLCYWKVETTMRTKIGTDICTLKLVYEASQEIAENSVHIFKMLRCAVLLQLTLICLTRTAVKDIENLIKIDWNCSKVKSFVGDCLFTDIISNVGKSLICCIYLCACDFWLLFTTRILDFSNFNKLLVGEHFDFETW